MKLKFILVFLLLTGLLSNCSSNSNDSTDDFTEQIDDTKDEETNNGDETEEEEEEEENNEETASFPVCEGVVQTKPEFVDKDNDTNSEKCDVFLEKNGLLIMEAENTKSDFGKWVFSDQAITVKDENAPDIHTTVQLKDHRGTGYLRFAGKWGDASESSPLVYKFKIKNKGTYRLLIRNLKGLNEEGDKHNDCFIKMEGNFEVGVVDACVKDQTIEPPKVDILKHDTKFFGASNEKWKPAGQLDAHGVSFKPWAVYNFKAGEIYTLTIKGRSSKYYIDRILLVDIHKYKWGEFASYVNNAVQNTCE